MATNNMVIKAIFALIKSVSNWLYKYEIYLVNNGVHPIEICNYPACAISTQIQPCFAITNLSSL